MVKNLILWLVIAIVLMSVFQSFTPGNTADSQLDYTTFINQVNQEQVSAVEIESNGVITGTLSNGQSFTTLIPTQYDPKLLDDLIKNNVSVKGVPPEEQSLLASIFINWFPMLLLIGIWIFFMRQMQGGGGKGAMSFGKSKARLLSDDQIKTTFADVAG